MLLFPPQFLHVCVEAIEISCKDVFLSLDIHLPFCIVVSQGSWYMPISDFHVFNLLNLKTHQTYYEAWRQWWFSCWIVSDSCYPMDCSPPGSSVHGILQAKILEWVANSFSRGSPQASDQTRASWVAGRSLPSEPLGKPLLWSLLHSKQVFHNTLCFLNMNNF